MKKIIRIGSRGSDLALWQAHFLENVLKDLGYPSQIIVIKTQGDKIQHLSLEKLEGKGFFTKEIEDALLKGEIDVAVHSHKDLPTAETPGLSIAAVSHREDASELILVRKECVDVLKIFQIKENGIIGTSSARRNVQLNFFRADLQCKDIRGNVPTRIDKLRKGDFDAIILANAGVKRLHLVLDDLHKVHINAQQIVPAPAQGVLAFQCRIDDDYMIEILKMINDPDVEKIISVERKVMNLFQGGCHMPLGVYCEEKDSEYNVWVAQADARGEKLKRIFVKSDSSDLLADKIFATINKKANNKVCITSKPGNSDLHLRILENRGFNVESVPFINIKRIQIDTPKWEYFDWIFFTSKNGVIHFFDQVKNINTSIKIAAIGIETARQIHTYGYKVDFIGEGENAIITNDFISIAEGKKILFPGALNRQPDLQEIISAYNSTVALPVYENTSFSAIKTDANIIVFTSALNAEGFLLENKISSRQIVIAIGSTTKKYLMERGIKNILTPPQKTLLSVAELICGLELDSK